MIFVTPPHIGRMVLKELKNAIEVQLAMAYFSPDEKILAALSNVPKLTLVISEEFTINDPYKLEKLPVTANVRLIPPSCREGKLHAKVVIIKRRDGSQWVLVGSANMTWQGFFSNQEACVALESNRKEDVKAIETILDWFNTLFSTSRPVNLEDAKKVFDTRLLYRLERRVTIPQTEESNYWALKTTSGSTGKDHWQDFLAESVIAIGWAKIKVDPSNVSDTQLRKAIASAYPKRGQRATDKIKKFVNLKVGDIALICRGYAPNANAPVHIYGFARIIGSFRDDRRSHWDWRFKHDVVFQVVDLYLSKREVAKALGKDSLMETIHKLDRARFEELVEILGVRLEV